MSNHRNTFHEHGHPAGFRPLLVVDVWEQAFMVDRRATERARYIDAVFVTIDRREVEDRFASAEPDVKHARSG